MTTEPIPAPDLVDELLSRVRRLCIRIDAAVWALRYRFEPKHQYHLIRTGLEPDYYDTDTVMLHGMMELLCEHVERGCGGEAILQYFTDELRAAPDPNAVELCEGQATSQAEVLAIYRWWRRERPADRALEEKWLMSLYGPSGGPPLCTHEQLWGLEAKLDATDQEMLHRLVDIRRTLWT